MIVAYGTQRILKRPIQSRREPAMQAATVARPTIEQFTAYQAAYDYFNERLFGGSLRPCILNFRGKSLRNMGIFWPNRWQRDGVPCHEISLNPDVLSRPLMDTFGTLVHEMCHQWQQDHGEPPRRNYHDKEWADKMESVGLIPSNTGAPGGKRTGQQMTHYVDPNGEFQRAVAEMPDHIALPWLSEAPPVDEKPAKSKAKVKYACGGKCDRVFWGKPGLAPWIFCECCHEFFREVVGGGAKGKAKGDEI